MASVNTYDSVVRELPYLTISGVHVARRRSVYLSLKFAAEWVLAGCLLLLAAPLMLLLAALVKATSAGPVLYAQTRLGLSGRQYRMYKLRTMRHGAEAKTGPVWAAKDDARITPIGKWLRETHLDELPQLWNVMRGQMALIGPRPERPELAARIAARVPNFHHRLQVRPGITGLAQMLLPADDPGDSDYQGLRLKLAHDLAYVKQVSLLLDLKIAVCTACYFAAAALDAVRRTLLRSYCAVASLDVVTQAAGAAQFVPRAALANDHPGLAVMEADREDASVEEAGETGELLDLRIA